MSPAKPARLHAAWRERALTFVVMLGLAIGTMPLAQAQTFTVLYSFAGYPTDGANPIGGLVMDAAGNLYGTTTYGGDANCPGSGIGCGTVFELDAKGVETVLHNFTGPDGAHSSANLVMDANGDLYGTTEFGGKGCVGNDATGCGVVFKLSGKKETVLHRFTGGQDGAEPLGGLIMDASGALYGTTELGGNTNCNPDGCGVVLKLVGKKETVLHSFKGPDGAFPTAALLMDSKGILYGTARYGGDFNCNCGVVFKLVGKKASVLHAFKGTPDGDVPAAGLFMDTKGNFYGTTALGGNSYNLGTIFEVSRSGKEHVLYRFGPPLGHAGFSPQTRVIRDAAGNLYGTTLEGGKAGAGIVFEVSKDGKEKVLHNFCSASGCADGAFPAGDLIMDTKGNLYGTAYGGGVNANGTVFMIAPQSQSD